MVSLIVAVDNNFGISRDNKIVWNYKEDYNFFIDTTSRIYKEGKNVLIMGKNTWLTLPKQLPNRITIVVSTTLQLETNDSLFIVKSLSEALELTKTIVCGRVFICGGKALYEESLPFVDSIFLTMIHHDYACDNIISLPLSHYKTHKKHTFELVDKMTEEKHFVSFHKLYLDELPAFWVIQKEEQQYLDLLEDILTNGSFHETRNEATWSIFAATLKFNLHDSYPLLTSKKCNFFGAFHESLFMLQGKTDTALLSDLGIKFWDGNTSRAFLDSVGLHHYEEKTMGSAYGFQIRYFNANYVDKHTDYTGQGFDQLMYCINLLKTDPYSRRIMMTTYNPAQASTGCLTPCHGTAIIFHTELKDNLYHLSCMMTQRSVDTGSGFYLNVCEYALYVYIFCEIINNDPEYKGIQFTPGKLIINTGNTHIYKSHYSQAIRQILRDPYPFPKLKINRKIISLEDINYDDFELINYNPYPGILCPMVV
jgi:thymidylate synthase